MRARWFALISVLTGCFGESPKATDDTNGDDSSGSTPVCLPGEQVDCACPGGVQGAQACAADGSGFMQCSCPGTDDSDGNDDMSSADDATSEGTTGGDDDTTSVDDTATADGTSDGGSSESGTEGGPASCSPYEQDCRTGQTCHPWADDGGDVWNANGCFDVSAMPAQAGEECTADDGPASGVDECDEGLVCYFIDETHTGVCVAQCTGPASAPSCSDMQTSCVPVVPDVADLCLPTCDPLLQSCMDAAGCYFGGVDVWVCLPSGIGAKGSACEADNDCANGLACLPADSAGNCASTNCCADLCDLTSPSCSSDEDCVDWYPPGEAPAEYVDVGVCAAAAQ